MQPNRRMCIVCRRLFDRNELIRFVLNADGVSVDYSGRTDGRGAYLCKSAECLEKLMKKRLLNRAFSRKVDESVYLAIAEEGLDKRQD